MPTLTPAQLTLDESDIKRAIDAWVVTQGYAVGTVTLDVAGNAAGTISARVEVTAKVRKPRTPKPRPELTLTLPTTREAEPELPTVARPAAGKRGATT